MSVSNILQNIAKPAVDTPTPSFKLKRWRFGDLSAAELLPRLQRHLLTRDNQANWQLVWLNNEGRPVIGLLPKVSWSVYFPTTQETIDSASPCNYKVVEIYRNNSTKTAYLNYHDWQQTLIAYSKSHNVETYNPSQAHSELAEKHRQQPRYYHGLIGFIGYDIAANELSLLSSIESIQRNTQPCAVVGHYDMYLSPCVIETGQTYWQLKVQHSIADDNQSDNTLSALIASYLEALDQTLSMSQNYNEVTSKPESLILMAQWHKQDYQRAFKQTQYYLLQGDCYQINLTQVWQGYLQNHELIDYLPALHRNTQAPFAGYLSVSNIIDASFKNTSLDHSNQSNNMGFELLSCSPELFLTFIKDYKTNTHHIRTKPIKGTMPRGASEAQDKILKQRLVDSDKDRSENVMIVDLLRNDLGRYAKTGTVKVPHLFAIESFSNVHHMVSTITAELKADIHPLTVLFGSLPAGSITGTPKKRAVEIISELEVAARGAYCGTMGYMNFDGSGQWNVLIRTLQAADESLGKKQVSLWAGGGITVSSGCAAEYQESLDKVGNLLSVLKQPNPQI